MVGKKIHEIRKKKGLKLTELAEKAHISKSYLSNIERNINKNPSIKVINKIVKVLDTDLESLLGVDVADVAKKYIEKEWIDFVYELKESGIDKEQIQEYKTIIQYIKWKNDILGEKR